MLLVIRLFCLFGSQLYIKISSQLKGQELTCLYQFFKEFQFQKSQCWLGGLCKDFAAKIIFGGFLIILLPHNFAAKIMMTVCFVKLTYIRKQSLNTYLFQL